MGKSPPSNHTLTSGSLSYLHHAIRALARKNISVAMSMVKSSFKMENNTDEKKKKS